jgi:hypothetical protein
VIDRAQLLDLAIAKMRAFVDEQEAKAAPPAEAKPAPASSSASSTAAPRPRPPLTTPPLRIPLIGSPRRP